MKPKRADGLGHRCSAEGLNARLRLGLTSAWGRCLCVVAALVAPTSTYSQPTDAGKPIPTVGGSRHFSIPEGYFRNRLPSYASAESWWLQGLWPGLTPWRENNPQDDLQFHAPGGGRMVMILVTFSDRKPQVLFHKLRPLMNESEDSRQRPDNTLAKRIRGKDKYGLRVYRVDFERVEAFRRKNGGSRRPLNNSELMRWKDWYIAQAGDEADFNAFIECTTQRVGDPPSRTGDKSRADATPLCTHEFEAPEFDATVTALYRRVYLPDWLEIQKEVLALMRRFQTG